MQATMTEVRQLVFAGPLSLWAWAGCAATLLALQLRHLAWARDPGDRTGNHWARKGVVAARLVGCALLLWALAGPLVRLQHGRPEARRLAVVVDNSRSMALATAAGPSRAAEATSVAQQLSQMADLPPVSWYNLAGSCNQPEACSKPTQDQTDLFAGLAASVGQGLAPLAGVLLVSDGIDTQQAAGPTALTPTQLQALGRLQVPVSTVAVGQTGQAFDLAVQDVGQDAFVFVKTTTEIDCVVGVDGKATRPIEVQLVRGREVVQQQVLPPAGGTDPLHAKFQVRADEVGEFVYACRVPAHPQELSHQNNQRPFVLRVLRDKVRVLHVVGRPSWDERFLRQELKNNRNVDVISFFILRTPESDTSIGEHELSLIPFPVARLFTSELRNFDVVILQNFDFRPYNMGQYLENLRDAVTGGLGLVMLGGPESFADGGYAGTPLAEVLPLQLVPQPAQDPEKLPGRQASFVPLLRRAGSYHPLLDIASSPSERAQILRSLPAIEGLSALGEAEPGAQVLVEARPAGAADPGSERRWPLVASRDVGRGRTLAIATDGLWRWPYAPNGPDLAGKTYARLWHNAWRWLSHDPQLSRLHVAAERPVAAAAGAGAQLAGSVRALGVDWQPLPAAQVQIRLVPHPQQAELGIPVPPSLPPPQRLALDDDGRAPWQFAGVPSGVWQVQAELLGSSATAPEPPDSSDPPDSGAEQAQQAHTTVVVPPPREDTALVANPNLLAAIAQATGGKALSAAAAKSQRSLPLAPPPPLRVHDQHDTPAWNHPVWVALFVATWSFAWALGRRREGR